MNTYQKSRLSTSRDYLALLVRRRWLILFAFLGCLGLALLLSAIIPDVYVSESLILFQPGEVSNDFVKEITNGTPDERLAAIQETILSRSHLLKIIKEFESGLNAYRGMSDDRKVDLIRKKIEIEFISEKVGNVQVPVTHVRVQYRDQNPELAQRITARLASLFVEKENQSREDQVYGTARFLTSELSKVAGRLTESSEKLKSIKERYKDQLPAQLEANMRTLDRLQQQQIANAEALDRQHALQLTLEQQIAQVPARLVGDVETIANVRKRNPIVDIYLQKKAMYEDLRAKATDKHPDVIRMKSELEIMRKSIPPEDFDSMGQPAQPQSKPKTEVNPVYQNLAAQLNQVKTEIDIRNKEKRLIESQINAVTLRVQSTPRAEQDIASVERANADLTKQADDLRAKLDQAKLAETLESKQQSAQFLIIDPANYPADPAAPNRVSLRLAGIGLSFGFALFLGMGVDLSRRRVFTSVEVERFLGTPVLVEIPKIVPSVDTLAQRRKLLRFASIVLIGAIMYGCTLYGLYENKGMLIRVLDPIIQNAGQANAQK